LTHYRSSLPMLYYYKLDDHNYITHDGHCQLGIIHDIEFFLNNVKVEYQETYWLPDTFNNRYKRINFQRHLQHQGKLPKCEK
jgi:hypothetical protein